MANKQGWLVSVSVAGKGLRFSSNLAKPMTGFHRCHTTYDDQSSLQSTIYTQLLSDVQPFLCSSPSRILELGSGTGLFTVHLLRPTWPLAPIDAIEKEPLLVAEARRLHAASHSHYYCHDLSLPFTPLPLSPPYPLILSNAALHWVPHFSVTLSHLLAYTDATTVLAFSVFGPSTYHELDHVMTTVCGPKTPPVIARQFATAQTYQHALADQWEIRATRCCRLTRHFESSVALFRYIQATGTARSSPQGLWTPRRLRAIDDGFKKAYGGVIGSYEVHYYVAVRK